MGKASVTHKKVQDIEMRDLKNAEPLRTNNAAPSQRGLFSNFSQRARAHLAYMRSERYLQDLRFSIGVLEGCLHAVVQRTVVSFPFIQLFLEGARAIIDRIDPPQQPLARRP